MDEPTSFASPTNIAWRGTTGIVEYGGGDRNMLCLFYSRPMPDAAKSAERGRPQFVDKTFVRISPPGERLNIVDREATDQDRQRFPMQWEQFRKRKQQQPEGTPIELLYPEQPSIGATLRANNVPTIEMCAELSGPAIDTIGMGSQTWVNAAKKYLLASNKGASQTQVRNELEQRDRTIRVLERQVKELKDQVDKLLHNNAQAPNLQEVQAMLAGLMQRPTHMPQQSFDPQSAMINASGADVRKRRRPQSR